ncbi:MAG: hypothetical protein J7497_15570 [Chitinophagaceae bacterium]|nr:hypothetical protein [Chitinophagaceae bacterium]
MQQLIASQTDTLDNQTEFLSTENSLFSTDTPQLLHNFALATGILAAISALVQMALHFFVPGM